MSQVLSTRTRAQIAALAAVILITGFSIAGASAQSLFARREQVIYEGNPLDTKVMWLGSWGSGWIEESTLNTYIGNRSLKVTPRDLYTGGRIDFVTLLDMTPAFKAPDIYFQVVTKFWGAQTGADELSVALGTPGSTDLYGGTYTPGKQVRKMRLVFFLEDGTAMECQSDVSSYRVGEDGWLVMSFPMAAIKGKTDLPQYKVKRLVITGDGTEPFHIGEIRTMRDSTPITADAGGDQEVSKNYSIAFQGYAQAGASAAKYSWDFDKLNGIQEEAVGDLVYHRFTKAGNYIVTLTVSDVFGLKNPSVAAINVKVNE